MTWHFTLPCLFALAAAPALAQDASAFQEEMIATANAAGEARLPVACAGLFHALSIAAGEDSADGKAMADKEGDAAVVAIIMHGKATGQDNDAATAAVIGYVDAVVGVYDRWFSANRAASGETIDDTIRGNFDYCERLRGDWVAAMGG